MALTVIMFVSSRHTTHRRLLFDLTFTQQNIKITYEGKTATAQVRDLCEGCGPDDLGKDFSPVKAFPFKPFLNPCFFSFFCRRHVSVTI
jgi:hypothetical protein